MIVYTKVKTQKIYIAGKITGDENYKQKFEEAEKELQKMGYAVLSPAVLAAGMTPADYMRICFAMIDTADEVCFLPDWKKSKGAQLEHAYCEYIGKEIYYVMPKQKKTRSGLVWTDLNT